MNEFRQLHDFNRNCFVAGLDQLGQTVSGSPCGAITSDPGQRPRKRSVTSALREPTSPRVLHDQRRLHSPPSLSRSLRTALAGREYCRRSPFAIRRVVFCRPIYGFSKPRHHSAHHGFINQFARPVMRRPAGLESPTRVTANEEPPARFVTPDRLPITTLPEASTLRNLRDAASCRLFPAVVTDDKRRIDFPMDLCPSVLLNDNPLAQLFIGDVLGMSTIIPLRAKIGSPPIK